MDFLLPTIVEAGLWCGVVRFVRLCGAGLIAGFYDAVGRAFDVLIDDDFTDGIGHYVSCSGIFDAFYMPSYVRFHAGILEGAVAASVKGTFLQHEVVGVAQWLLAADMAVYEA